eukprot:TRINITY_DN5636_c1_g3_i3.p1 TRINITY_DN5636_c1_g3~~TRINITY_DN5636_c1_g3_i3.p1  ORF type:complete len:192 (+),score=38.22 TRINITY_DN5636_c1_g3_i3:28-576(+)
MTDSRDSSYGYRECRNDSREEECEEGPCLWWLREQVSGCTDDEETVRVQFFDRRKAAVFSKDSIENMEKVAACDTIEFSLHKATKTLRCTSDGVVTRINGRVHLYYDPSSGGPNLNLLEVGMTIGLPSQPSHLALVLPELCDLFTEAGVEHNLGKWGALCREEDEDVLEESPQVGCSLCAVM